MMPLLPIMREPYIEASRSSNLWIASGSLCPPPYLVGDCDRTERG